MMGVYDKQKMRSFIHYYYSFITTIIFLEETLVTSRSIPTLHSQYSLFLEETLPPTGSIPTLH